MVKIDNRNTDLDILLSAILGMETHCQNPTLTNGFPENCAMSADVNSPSPVPSISIYPEKLLFIFSLAQCPIRFAQPDKTCHLKLRATRCVIFDKMDGRTGSQGSQHNLSQGWVNYGYEKNSTKYLRHHKFRAKNNVLKFSLPLSKRAKVREKRVLQCGACVH